MRGPDECWPWSGYVAKNGYPFVTVEGETRTAHRAVYEHMLGPIPKGMELDHLCRNPQCVNPRHMEPVTPRENNMRSSSPAALAARKTHCVRGHPLSGDNVTLIERQGGRVDRRCKTCHRERQRKYTHAA